MVRAYRKADEYERRRQNESLWLQGMYFYEALCDAAPILHAFAKKGTKPNPYTKEPYPITESEIREHEEREAKAREEKFKAEFAAFAERMRNKMPKEAHPDSRGGEINERNDKH